jgi:hypothetical protein
MHTPMRLKRAAAKSRRKINIGSVVGSRTINAMKMASVTKMPIAQDHFMFQIVLDSSITP